MAGSLSEEQILEIAKSCSGTVRHREGQVPDLYIKTSRGRYTVSSARLGVAPVEDPFGAVTTKTKPKSLREALEHLDKTAESVKQG